MKYTKYPELKAELKELVKEIRQWKSWRKPINRRGTDLKQWDVDFKVFILKREFRHKHIAYCQLNGTPYFMIECPRNDNKPDSTLVRKIMEKYEQQEEKEHVFYRNN